MSKKKVKGATRVAKLKHHVVNLVKDIDDPVTLQNLSNTLQYKGRIKAYHRHKKESAE